MDGPESGETVGSRHHIDKRAHEIMRDAFALVADDRVRILNKYDAIVQLWVTLTAGQAPSVVVVGAHP